MFVKIYKKQKHLVFLLPYKNITVLAALPTVSSYQLFHKKKSP